MRFLIAVIITMTDVLTMTPIIVLLCSAWATVQRRERLKQHLSQQLGRGDHQILYQTFFYLGISSQGNASQPRNLL